MSKIKCKDCGYEIEDDQDICPRCEGTGNYFWMENVRSLTVEVDNFIETYLKKFEIELTPKQQDRIHDRVWEVLEEISNGYYKHYN